MKKEDIIALNLAQGQKLEEQGRFKDAERSLNGIE